MTMNQNRLRERPPTSLGPARISAHRAVQLLSRVALSNLAPEPDYSHDNLGWWEESATLVTHPIPTKAGSFVFGLVIPNLEIVTANDGVVSKRFELNGASNEDAEAWLDRQLGSLGLHRASNVDLPYELPPEINRVDNFVANRVDLAVLASWLGLGHRVLSTLIDQIDDALSVNPVRCWPHHFDLGTFVTFEAGDTGSATGVGLGLSPGDDYYAQPYFYIRLDPPPESKCTVPPPGHWHDDGFRGMVATADELLTRDNIASGAVDFVQNSFSIASEHLGY